MYCQNCWNEGRKECNIPYKYELVFFKPKDDEINPKFPPNFTIYYRCPRCKNVYYIAR